MGQELEDVLAERDALKVVNTELAMKLTAPGPNAGTEQPQQVPEDSVRAQASCSRARYTHVHCTLQAIPSQDGLPVPVQN